jgi:hypothetical protein
MATSPRDKIRSFHQLAATDRRGELQPIAVLTLSPPELTTSYGIEFQRDSDDLDAFDVALLEFENGDQFALLHYLSAETGGTELYAAESADPEQACEEFLASFAMEPDQLEWTREDVQLSQGSTGLVAAAAQMLSRLFGSRAP